MKNILKTRKQAVINAKRMAAYAAAGAAAICGADQANADITHVILGTPVADTVLGGGGVGLDLAFGDLADWNIALAHGLGTTNAATGYAFLGDLFTGGMAADFAGFVAGAYNYANNVAYNAPISALPFLTGVDGTMAFNAGYGNDQFLAVGVGFIGVRFNTNQYGWIRVNMNGAPLNTFTIVDYAWADAGESINAGQTIASAVPEAGSLGLLALGAIGVASWRRRRLAA